MIGDLPLFAAPSMHRAGDHATSVDAARQVSVKIHELHRAVFAAVLAAGPDGLTDRELEQLPPFAHYGPSTIRKRRSELYQSGYLTHQSTRHGLMVWVPVPGVPHP
jgi:hypothetical protein